MQEYVIGVITPVIWFLWWNHLKSKDADDADAFFFSFLLTLLSFGSLYALWLILNWLVRGL